MKNYRIGDIAYLLGLSAESLRHYERKGIIHPMKAENSSYRYYSPRDLIVLCGCRHYRALGLSLEETTALLNAPNADAELSILDEQERQLEDEIERLSQTLRALREWKSVVKRTTSLIGRVEIVPVQATLCLPYQQGDRITDDPYQRECAREWMSHTEYTYIGGIVPWQGAQTALSSVTIYLCVAEAVVSIPKLTLPESVVRLPARHCLHTAFRLHAGEDCMHKAVSTMEACLKQEKLTPTGDLFYRFCLISCEQNSVGGLMDCYLPID